MTPRINALLNSGLMPSTLRSLLIDAGKQDWAPIKNNCSRVDEGKIADADCTKIREICQGIQREPLDEFATWTPEFVSTLPPDLKDGLLIFPASKVGVLNINHVLALDEVVLDDSPDILLNDRPTEQQSEPRPLHELSPGQRCSAILPLLLLPGNYPLIIDQPEENLDNRLIRQVIVNILASMKLQRQIIIATHNPNLPVLGDAEQCVLLQASGRDRSRLVAEGSLDSPKVANYITDIMEGGREAFQYRQSIYQTHWDSDVDEFDPVNS